MQECFTPSKWCPDADWGAVILLNTSSSMPCHREAVGVVRLLNTSFSVDLSKMIDREIIFLTFQLAWVSDAVRLHVGPTLMTWELFNYWTVLFFSCMSVTCNREHVLEVNMFSFVVMSKIIEGMMFDLFSSLWHGVSVQKSHVRYMYLDFLWQLCVWILMY